MYRVGVLCIILTSMSAVINSARILALVLFPGRSHWIVMEPLFQELAARGHQVTVFSSFPQKKPLANYTDVDFSKQMPPIISEFSIDMLRARMPNRWKTPFFINDIHTPSCKMLEEPAFKKLLTTKDQYDLLITELFGEDCFTYFAYKFKIPLISFTTSVNMPWGSERVGLPDNPAYIPNYLVNFTPYMTLYERIYNTVILLYAKYWHLYVFSRNSQTIAEKSFGESLPPLHEVVANTSILFVNSYHALAQSRPFPPNVIEVGGIHIKKAQPIEKDLLTILDNAKNGAIVMSFGSLVRTATIPKSIIMMFMNAFAKIPQTVIFKYEEDLPEAPPNVITRKWLSQRDIVAHKNVLAVIVHGGLASTIENIYLGKPLIGIPIFADQCVNIQSVKLRGAGIQLDLDNLSEEKISQAISEILHNPKYTENMKQLSLRFRDRPMTALETAVYWTEYVIRHKGAPHLQPASVKMPFYQYLLLDVVAVLLVVLTAVIWVLAYLTKCAMSSFRRKKDNVAKKKKIN